MISPNSLIFPHPKHRNPLQALTLLNEEILYIEKEENPSHIKDLKCISRQAFSQRFSHYEIQNQLNQSPKQKVQKMNFKIDTDVKKRKITTISTVSARSSQKTTARYNSNTQHAPLTSRKLLSLEILSIQESKLFQNQNSKTPCLFITSPNNQNPHKLLVYYHANGQDMLNCYGFVKKMSIFLKTSILVVEYPNYSIYKSDKETTADKILEDVSFLMKYIQKKGYLLENVFVIGRSIGTGPACHIASKYSIGGLILLSPFSRFKQVVRKLYGEALSLIVKEPFDNLGTCADIFCPVLIVHGYQDKTITFQHSLELAEQIKGYCSLKIVPNMSHNRFDYQRDFFTHLQDFVKDIESLKRQQKY